MSNRSDSHTVHRGKGRPRCFDRDKALTMALRVFWRHGYERASLVELCQAMEINPPSLYAAFGNKAKLFLEAVAFYEKTYWEAPSKKLMADPDVYRGIEVFFQEAAYFLVLPDSPCGCMVVLAAINISEDAEEITGAIRALRMATKNMFAHVFQRGVDTGQLPADTDVVGMSWAFNTMLEGLSIQARDGLSQAELTRISSYAVRLLPKKQS